MPHTQHRYDYWFVEVPTSYCHSNGIDIVQTCNFTFAFCGTLPTKRVGPHCSGAAVCQDGIVEKEFDDFHPFAYNMGHFTGFSYSKYKVKSQLFFSNFDQI